MSIGKEHILVLNINSEERERRVAAQRISSVSVSEKLEAQLLRSAGLGKEIFIVLSFLMQGMVSLRRK